MLRKLFSIVLFCFFGACFCSEINWSLPYDVSEAGESAAECKIAMNDHDQAIALWRRFNGSEYVIQTAYSIDGGNSWSSPYDLSSAAGQARSNQIAINQKGEAIAVWIRDNGSDYVVQESHSPDGGMNWSLAKDLSVVVPTLEARAPQIAIDENSNAIAVWYRSNGTYNIIRESHSFDAGDHWSPPQDLSLGGPPGGNAFDPQIAFNNNSQAIVVWYRDDGSNRIVQETHSFDLGVNWTTPPQDLSLGGPPGGDALLAGIAMNESGEAVAIWRRDNGTNIIIQESYSSDAGVNWSTPPQDLSLGGPPGGNADRPQVAMNDNGLVITIWYRDDGSNRIIQEAHSLDAGVHWTIPQDLTETGYDAYLPQIQLSNNNEAIAAWFRFDGFNTRAQSSYSANGGTSWITQTLSEGGKTAHDTQVAINESSQTIIMWEKQDDALDYILQTSFGLLKGAFEVNYQQYILRTLLQKALINRLSWDSVPGSAYYKVFADSALSQIIYLGSERVFSDRIKRGESKTYYVVWVDSFGNESPPVIVNIP